MRPTISVKTLLAAGLAAGLGAALLLARIPGVGRGLAAVGRRTLAIYVVHSAVVVVTVVVLWETGLSGLLVDHGPAAVLGLTGLGFLAGLALHRVAAGTALLAAQAVPMHRGVAKEAAGRRKRDKNPSRRSGRHQAPRRSLPPAALRSAHRLSSRTSAGGVRSSSKQ